MTNGKFHGTKDLQCFYKAASHFFNKGIFVNLSDYNLHILYYRTVFKVIFSDLLTISAKIVTITYFSFSSKLDIIEE